MLVERHVEEFGQDDIAGLSGLDVIACQVSAPGACGYHGCVFLVTSDGRILRTCYLEPGEFSGYHKYTPEEKIPEVFPAFGSLRDESGKWKMFNLGLGNLLFVRNDYQERFSEAANAFPRADVKLIMYTYWVDALFEVLEPGVNDALLKELKREADERESQRQRIVSLQADSEQRVSGLTRGNVFRLDPEEIVLWRCSNVAEAMDREGNVYRLNHTGYDMLKGKFHLLFYRRGFLKTFFPMLKNMKKVQRLLAPAKTLVNFLPTKGKYPEGWTERDLPGYTLLVRNEYVNRLDGLRKLFHDEFCSSNAFGIIKCLVEPGKKNS